MKNKILYFGKMDFPFNNASACRVMGVCSALVKEDFECFAYGHTKGEIFDGNVDNIAYHNDKYPKNLFQYLFTFGKKKNIKRVLDEFNSDEIAAVFFTSIGHRQLKYLGKWCSKNRIPLIFDCGDINRHSTKHFLYKIISSMEFKIFNRCVRKYASVMAISSYIYEMFNKKCFYTFKVPCITDKQSARFNIKPSNDVDTTKMNVGYFGVPGKNFIKDRLDWCLTAFKELNRDDINFYVGGIKESELPEQFRGILNVKYLGPISNKECISITKQLDYVVFYRPDNEITRAGFASKVTEAFACNVPVMTNITSDLKTYLNEHNSLTVESFEYEGCKELFDRLSKTAKSDIQKMKSYIERNDELGSQKWGSIIKENILAIQKKLNS